MNSVLLPFPPVSEWLLLGILDYSSHDPCPELPLTILCGANGSCEQPKGAKVRMTRLDPGAISSLWVCAIPSVASLPKWIAASQTSRDGSFFVMAIWDPKHFIPWKSRNIHRLHGQGLVRWLKSLTILGSTWQVFVLSYASVNLTWWLMKRHAGSVDSILVFYMLCRSKRSP